MKRTSNLAAIGGYQPFFFCIGMYVVALFFSIFICSAIFYALNPKRSMASKTRVPEKAMMVSGSPQVLLTVTK